jgi:hypothetical protein
MRCRIAAEAKRCRAKDKRVGVVSRLRKEEK